MKIVNATIKYPAGKIIPSKYAGKPGRQNIILTLQNGQEATIWKNEGDRALSKLKKGDTIQVAVDGDNYDLITDDDEEPEETPQKTEKPQERIKKSYDRESVEVAVKFYAGWIARIESELNSQLPDHPKEIIRDYTLKVLEMARERIDF
ncbi:MAG: hypothetical protein ACRC78_03045 [Planktothrix sp.]